MPNESELEIRCTCRRHPLLGVCGVDANRKPFIQVKKMKGGNIEVHAVVTEGSMSIQCRECYRWMTVKIEFMKIQQSIPASSLPRELATLPVFQD